MSNFIDSFSLWIFEQKYQWENYNLALTCKKFADSLPELFASSKILTVNKCKVLGYPIDSCLIAARIGNLELLQNAFEFGCGLGCGLWLPGHLFNAIDFAAQRGDLQMLEWMQPHVIWEREQIALGQAAANGQLETLIWLIQQGVNKKSHAFYMACTGGSIHILEYLLKHYPNDLGDRYYTAAFAHNQFHVWCWLFDHGLRVGFDQNLLKKAKRSLNPQFVQWAANYKNQNL